MILKRFLLHLSQQEQVFQQTVFWWSCILFSESIGFGDKFFPWICIVSRNWPVFLVKSPHFLPYGKVFLFEIHYSSRYYRIMARAVINMIVQSIITWHTSFFSCILNSCKKYNIESYYQKYFLNCDCYLHLLPPSVLISSNYCII